MNRFVAAFACMILALSSTVLTGQQTAPTPQLISVFPAGGQTGKTFRVVIQEQLELEFAENLIFNHSGITATPVLREKDHFFPKESRIRNEFMVTVASSVPAGMYEVRAVCEYGVSNPRRFVVGENIESLEKEPNDRATSAQEIKTDQVVNGNFESGYDYYQWTAPSNQTVVIKCYSHLIDSRGDPVLSVYDASGKLIQKNHDSVGRDAVVSISPEKNQTYTICVHDLTFTSSGGAGTTPYRLSISHAPWIDFVDPPVLQIGTSAKVKVYGRNLGGDISKYHRSGAPMEMVEVDLTIPKTQSFRDHSESLMEPGQYTNNRFAYRFQRDGLSSNPIEIVTTFNPVSTEEDFQGLVSNASPTFTSSVHEILGVFAEPGETDAYQFSGKKGDKVRIEVLSQRLGLGTDPLLRIQSVDVQSDKPRPPRTLKTVDDFQPLASPLRLRLETEDPVTYFDVPEDGTYQLLLSDQFNLPANACGPNFYLLRVNSKSAELPTVIAMPGLESGTNGNNNRPLRVSPCIVRKNSHAEVQIFATSPRAEGEEITIRATDLPKGVQSQPVILGASENNAVLLLSGDDSILAGHAPFKIVASVIRNGKTIEIPVACAEITSNSIGNGLANARLAQTFFVSTDDSLLCPGKIKLGQSKIETAHGGIVELTAKFEKNKEFKGAITQAFVHGLPREISRNTNNLSEDGAEAKYRIDIRNQVKPGTYSGFVRGYIDLDLQRFQSKMDEATAEQKRIATELQKIESDYRRTTQTSQRLNQQVSQQRSRANAARTAAANLKRTLASAQTETQRLRKIFSAATTEVTKTEAEISKLTTNLANENDANQKKTILTKKQEAEQRLKNAKQIEASAIQNVNAASAREKVQTESLTEAMKTEAAEIRKLQELEASLKKTQLDEKRLADLRQKGTAYKQQADQDLNLARQASAQRSRRLHAYSDPFTLVVDDFPTDIQLSRTDFQITAGESVPLEIKVTRKYGFEGDLNFRIQSTNGGNGWNLKQNSTIKKGTDSTKAQFATENYSKPGKFEGELSVQMRFNNTNLTQIVPITVTVLARPKK